MQDGLIFQFRWQRNRRINHPKLFSSTSKSLMWQMAQLCSVSSRVKFSGPNRITLKHLGRRKETLISSLHRDWVLFSVSPGTNMSSVLSRDCHLWVAPSSVTLTTHSWVQQRRGFINYRSVRGCHFPLSMSPGRAKLSVISQLLPWEMSPSSKLEQMSNIEMDFILFWGNLNIFFSTLSSTLKSDE